MTAPTTDRPAIARPPAARRPVADRYPPAVLAAAFDARLGDPAEAAGAFSARRCAELDRTAEFPAEICELLDALGLPSWYVPASHGGSLRDFDDLIQLVRVLARRDVTVAVAHAKTFLGASCVWVGGDRAQAAELARQVRNGARVSWALTEPQHGADLLAGEVTATPDRGGYLLDGEKWPVNNATLGSHACVLARTSEAGGSRGFSLLLVDKSALRPGQYRHLPKAATLGIRGADISGIAFTGAWVPARAMVGAPGTGAETVLRALQLTRTMCTGLSLGAAEHALALVTEFTAGRIIQGRPLIERPYVRAVLARSAAVLLAAEAVTTIGSRAAHYLTGEMSVVSAVLKALLPTLVDQLIDELSELLGSRSFLDGVYAEGAFQKVQRDHKIVGIFDGSTAVNRAALIGQFPRLAAGRRGIEPAVWPDGLARIGERPPPLETGRLVLASRAGCTVVHGLPAAAARADGPLGAAARASDELTAAVRDELAAVRPTARPAAASVDLAVRYELCFAAAACLHLWHGGSAEPMTARSPLWQDALWPRACLAELNARLAQPGVRLPAGCGVAAEPDLTGRLVDWLATSVAAGQPLSLWQPAGATAVPA
jgi:alkylation response protein AidB-like acyl-CoA dehydrogenase